jgi:hypothetical protein
MNVSMNSRPRAAVKGTRKVTISLKAVDLEVMARFAKRRHRGNLSGAFAELIEHAARLEAMDRVLLELPKPSARGLAALENELARPLSAPSLASGTRKKKAA